MKTDYFKFLFIGSVTSFILAVTSVASILNHIEKKPDEVSEPQKAGFCFPSFSDETKLVWRPCNDQYGQCEITYFSQTHHVPLFQLSSCGSCMARNGFDANEIDTICMQHGIPSVKNAILSSRGAK